MSTTPSKIHVPSSIASLDLTSPFPVPTTNPNPTIPNGVNDTQPPTTIQIPQTLPPSTRKSLLNRLQSTDSIPPLNELLTRTLTQSTTTQPPGAADWPSRVHALALELLRSRACAPNFSDLMSEITRRALSEPPPRVVDAMSGGKGEKRGKSVRVRTMVLPNGSYGEDGLPDVRIPAEVVESGTGFLEERLKESVEIVDSDDGREEEDG